MTQIIIPLLQAPATIKGFLFLNNNIQNYAPNEDNEINEVAAGIDIILLPAIANTTSIIRMAYIVNH